MPASSGTETQGRPVLKCVLVVAVFVFLFDTFRVGIVRDVHDVLGLHGWGRANFAIGAAITELAHGVSGHAISNVVEATLIENGLTNHAPTLARLGVKFPDNLRNAQLIDNAIRKAVAAKGAAGTLRGAGGDDLGFADFAKIGFFLFGYQLIALYLLFFLIQGVSVAVFAAVFRDRPLALCVLLVLVLAQWAVFRSVLLDERYMGATSDPRFLSILAMIPGLHLAFVLTEGLRPTSWNIAAIALQACIVAFIVLIRASAVWVPFGLALLGIALLVSTGRRAPLLRRCGRLWSLGILLACLVLQQAWLLATLHPVYKEKKELTHHVVWHSFFFALALNPDWNTKYAAQFDHASFDEVPPTAAKKYLLRHPPADPDQVYLTPDRQYLKTQALETYTRKAFVEFLFADPTFVADTFLYYNPSRFLRSLAELARPTLATGAILAGMALAIAMIGATLAMHPALFRSFLAATALLVAALALSSAPIVLTAPSTHVMTDPFTLLIAVLVGLGACGAALVFPRLQHAHAGQARGAARNTAAAESEEPPMRGTSP